jgi:hypothetical protein
MDACAKICRYYLYEDGVEPISFEGGRVVFPPVYKYNPSTGNTRNRRILIYSEFPTKTKLLQNVRRSYLFLVLVADDGVRMQVLTLHGVESLAIDGTLSFEKRDRIVSQFHQPDSPRVLIISKVGSAGLNLSIADIVLYFVRHVARLFLLRC